MHIKKVDFLMYQKETNNYVAPANGYVNKNNLKELVLDNNLQKQYINQGKILVVEEVKRDNYQASQQAIDALHRAGIAILVPLGAKNRIVGLIALEAKESADPYNNEDIRVLGIIGGLSASIIENANLYTETRDKNIKLKELLEMKTDFLRVVNHQLNTPLSIMRNALGAVKDGTLPLERSLEIANKGLERINSTLSDFWSAMELEGEREKSELAKTNIEKIVYEIVDEKEEMELVKTKGLQLKINKPEYDLPFVICDAKKISYAVSNLIDNAIFYTKEGKVNITFEKIEDNGIEYLKIYVSDTGSGIKPADRKNLFKKFARGAGASKLHPDGSGLGLYISEKIVEDSHGQLKLENTVPNVGTTFSITLPVQK
jgi:signal transduction histidine kinase